MLVLGYIMTTVVVWTGRSCLAQTDTDSELHHNLIVNAPQCSYRGTYEGGFCSCPRGTFGLYCECLTDDIMGEGASISCRATNSTNVCNGRGQCVCGMCQCFPRADDRQRVYGRECECDNFSCPHLNGLPCGGPEHGVCDCGFCMCRPDWAGHDCGCRVDNSTCISKNGLECNGHGVCVCGECICHPQLFSGPTCEDCPSAGMCDTLKPCAQCQAFGTGELKDGSLCSTNCTLLSATLVDQLKTDMPGEGICQFRDESDFCTFFFSYYNHPQTGKLMVEVRKTKVCPEVQFG